MARPIFSPKIYVEGIRNGNRVLLAQAISLIESTRPEHQKLADEIISELISDPNFSKKNTLRIGITGSPGVGKSTFIEAMGMFLIEKGHRVAVLAIDPTSQISRGSILGDKTRMEQLSMSENAFIRPSPSGNSLGGVARKTRETILLVEAAGFDIVFVETVGVGQSETAVRDLTDIFLLLLLPGAGDELQGIKRGIVEMADILVVNKSDGDRVKLANQARANYLNATHLLPQNESGWSPKVLTCSALEKIGQEEIWKNILDFQEKTLASGWFFENRKRQNKSWMLDAIRSGLLDSFFSDPEIRAFLEKIEPDVLAGKVWPFGAAREALGIFLKK